MEAGKPTGMMLAYGMAIGQALFRGGAKDDELLALRDQANEMLRTQGDLAAAVAALDDEIAKRGGATAKRAPPAPPESRFLIHLTLPLPPERRARLEQAINKVVLEELAGFDTKGDLVATPLSEIKAFGARWPGGATAGMWIEPRLPR
jgi:hypothetical protein